MLEINTKYDFRAVADTRIGGRAENQDSFGYDDTPLGLLLVVCDGMGGGPSGKTASMLVAQTVVGEIKSCSADMHPINAVEKAVKSALKVLGEAQASTPSNAGMGTTLAMILISEQSAIVAHVGDSRVYQFRHGRRVFRTIDHSQIYEILKPRTYAQEEEARLAPNSNIITRALGPIGDVKADIVELPYEKGDRFVICTDGIWGMLTGKELVKLTARTKSILGAVQATILTVDERGVAEGNHHDNMTLAILETQRNSKLKQAMSTKVRNIIIALCIICGISIILNFIQYRSHVSNDSTQHVLSDDEIKQKIALLENQNKELGDRLEQQQKANEQREKALSAEMHLIKEQVDKGDISGVGNYVNEASQRQDLIVAIDELIKLLEKQRDVQNKNECETLASKTQQVFGEVVNSSKALGVKNKEFEKCVDEKWINHELVKNPKNRNHKSHLNAIISSLQALKTSVRASQ